MDGNLIDWEWRQKHEKGMKVHVKFVKAALPTDLGVLTCRSVPMLDIEIIKDITSDVGLMKLGLWSQKECWRRMNDHCGLTLQCDLKSINIRSLRFKMRSIHRRSLQILLLLNHDEKWLEVFDLITVSVSRNIRSKINWWLNWSYDNSSLEYPIGRKFYLRNGSLFIIGYEELGEKVRQGLI